ncbi:hypothetical protein [Acetobacter papayae]|uniref:hypothetical protein n=1 Tax=Acetobacter papayae TaxID=1076592 RepID=UPI001F3FEE5B|nr:hypothetical protein [Acetobacter papayae]
MDYTIASTVLPAMLHYTGGTFDAWWITTLVIIAQALLIAFSTKATQAFNAMAVTLELIGMSCLVVLLFVVGWYRHSLISRCCSTPAR